MTRLLDWSTSALVALFFAVEDPDYDAGEDPSAVLALCAGDDLRLLRNPLGAEALIVHEPAHVDQRIAVQSSVFTEHPKGFHTLTGDDQPTQTWPQRWPSSKRTIEIPAPCRRSIREHLAILRIHRASLFLGPDGIAAFLNAHFAEGM